MLPLQRCWGFFSFLVLWCVASVQRSQSANVVLDHGPETGSVGCRQMYIPGIVIRTDSPREEEVSQTCQSRPLNRVSPSLLLSVTACFSGEE